MLQIGDQVAGYVLRRALGEGGFGVVYLADDLALGRSVAVKVMAEGSADDVSLRDRFRQEARHAARLDHAHVVPVYAAGEDRGRLYLAMRYVPGEDLSRRLRRTGPVPPAQALDWVLQVGSALDAAHGQRLLHRDVKPANVLLTRDHTGRDHLYLADFGISQALQGTSARLTRAVGTLDYCAPEVFEDAPVDPRTDLYALACLTVELLVGRPPFSAPTEAGVISGHLHGHPPQVSASVPGVPRQVDAVLGTALAKRRQDRQASVAVFTSALTEALEGHPGQHRPAAAPRSPAAGDGVARAATAPLPSRRPQAPAAAGSHPGFRPVTPRQAHVRHRRRRGLVWLAVVLVLTGASLVLDRQADAGEPSGRADCSAASAQSTGGGCTSSP